MSDDQEACRQQAKREEGVFHEVGWTIRPRLRLELKRYDLSDVDVNSLAAIVVNWNTVRLSHRRESTNSTVIFGK